jgi:ribosome-interacting GTPase 1
VYYIIFDVISLTQGGQSTLMSKLTGTHSETSEIDFTTLTTVPGTVKVHGAPIQILDLR